MLHIPGYGSPGALALENEDGSARLVAADEFVDQVIPPGRMPPVIILSAPDSAAVRTFGVTFASQLRRGGATAVIALNASINDTYAARLLAHVYGALAQAPDPDVITALAEARRLVQAELQTSPDQRDHLTGELGEWAAVSVLAATGSVPVLDPRQSTEAVQQPPHPRIAGLAERDDWYFVGRRAEQRHWPGELTGLGRGS